MKRLTFGEAIEALKQGKKVTRKGWNGKRMYLWLKPATTIKAEWCKDPMLKEIVDANGGEAEALGTICMKTADNKILTGWLASQTDILSEDWMIIPSDAEIEEFYFVREPDHMIEYSRDIATWSNLDVIKQKHKIFKTKEEALEYQKQFEILPLPERIKLNIDFAANGLHKEYGYSI